MGFLASLVYAYGGLVGTQSILAPAFLFLPEGTNWPLFWTGIYSAFILFVWAPSPHTVQQLEERIRNTPSGQTIKHKLLKIGLWIARYPIESQAVLNLPTASGFMMSAFSPSGSYYQVIAAVAVIISQFLRIFVPEKQDPSSPTGIWDWISYNPLKWAVVFSVVAQLANMISCFFADAPSPLFLAGVLTLWSFFIQFSASKHQNRKSS